MNPAGRFFFGSNESENDCVIYINVNSLRGKFNLTGTQTNYATSEVEA